MTRVATRLAKDVSASVAVRSGLSMFPPSDAAMLEYWHSELGVSLVGDEVDSWTGQIAGIVCQAPSSGTRPAYGTDGSNFNTHRVVRHSNSEQRRLLSAAGLNAGLLPLANQRPYVAIVFRYRALAAAQTNQGNVSMYSGTTHAVFIRHLNNTNLVARNPTTSDQMQTTGSMGTSVHFAEVWSDGSAAHLRVDGSEPTPLATSNALAANLNRITLGADNGTTACADLSQAFIGIFSAKPSDSYIEQLRSWAQGYWGAP